MTGHIIGMFFGDKDVDEVFHVMRESHDSYL